MLPSDGFPSVYFLTKAECLVLTTAEYLSLKHSITACHDVVRLGDELGHSLALIALLGRGLEYVLGRVFVLSNEH